MGRRHVVRDLDEEQFDFVINAIIAGNTDREISLAFEQKFGRPLAKSSLNRWRKSAGDELADRYRLARFQAKQLLSDLKEEDGDTYQVVIRNIEDKLLTATREVISKDPVKLLKIRQEEERRRLREKELELKGKKLEFDKERAQREERLRVDRLGIAADVWKYILFWFTEHDPATADRLTRHSEELLDHIESQIEGQTA
jgi:hypothetical protein